MADNPVSEQVESFLWFVVDVSRKLDDKRKERELNHEDFLCDLLRHLDLLGKAIQFLNGLRNLNLDPDDLKSWKEMEDVFSKIEKEFLTLYKYHNEQAAKHHSSLSVSVKKTGAPGRPSFFIPKELLVELRGLNFSWTSISKMFGVSRWTILRRVEEYGFTNLQKYSDITDEQIENILKDYISRHGSTTGEPFMSGYFRSIGLHIQRSRIRSALNRVDPHNTILRWGALVSRRKYFVKWPNSLWHIDGHHSLIRWKFVVHGCCDGKSRKIMFLKCSTNNLAETVLQLFKNAIRENEELWPSRIRVDYGVENVSVCDEMVAHWGEGRRSFIAGASTSNQRIERLWRDVYRCVSHFFYYTFYAMEQTGILDIENPIHLFALHLVFTRRINMALEEFSAMFNNHRLSTERNWTPNQIWFNGLLHVDHPVNRSNPIDDSVVDQYYGEDPDSPRPQSDDDYGVVVSPVEIPNMNNISNFVLQQVDVGACSNQAGIDIYIRVLQLVVQNLQEYMHT